MAGTLQHRALRYEEGVRNENGEMHREPDISVLQYNILADAAIPKGDQGFNICGHYLHCKKEFRYMDSRHGRIISEVRELSADVVTFQEIEVKHFHECLLPDLEKLGYNCVHHLRSYDHLGMVICFKADKFSLISQKDFIIHESITDLLLEEEVDEEVVCSVVEYMKEMSTYPSVAQPPGCLMVTLDCKLSGTKFAVATTHITWKHCKYPLLQILQAYSIFSQFARFADGMPSIFSGDFNTKPDTPLYSYITSGQVCDLTLERLMADDEYDTNVVVNKQNLLDLVKVLKTERRYKSSYHTVMGSEAAYTDCTEMASNVFEKSCFDYIWYRYDMLHPVAVLDTPQQLVEFIPNEIFPSDHLLIYAKFHFNNLA